MTDLRYGVTLNDEAVFFERQRSIMHGTNIETMIAADRKTARSISVVVLLAGTIFLAVGDYIYRSGTSVTCGFPTSQSQNNPAEFHPPGAGRGPFRGPGWNRWVGYDLSRWWFPDIPVELVYIDAPKGPVRLEAWWIAAADPPRKPTVIMAHGLNSSRRDFNILMPTSMLVRHGFNVLMIDLRDQGGTTCQDARHSAGQDESDDILTAANWLKTKKAIPLERTGVHGVSGGALAAIIAAAKNPVLAAFSLDSPIFDFDRAAAHEVAYQGFPGVLWRAAYWSARLRGIDLMAVSPSDGLNAMGHRPVQVFHGNLDSRVPYHNALALMAYAQETGVHAILHTFEDADHTEGLLIDPERYERELTRFFSASLRD